MLTKKIILGMLVSLLSLSFSSAAISGGDETPNVYLGDKDSSNTIGKDGIESAFSPMTINSGLASASSKNTDSEVIDFDSSPRRNSIGSVLSIKKDRKDIEFDYSPRPVKCMKPYC